MTRKGSAEFTAATRRALAARVGHECSFPGCGRRTIGPSEESTSGVILLGDAAHIVAAGSGPAARRADPAMEAEDLRDIANGIWLCPNHHRLIDGDQATHSVEQLRAYKQQAEAKAKKRLIGESETLIAAHSADASARLLLKRPETRLRSVADPNTAIELLNPAALALPLMGRDREMTHLLEWLDTDDGISVHGVVGDGGMGKTRLALELCTIAREEGWTAGFLEIGRTRHWPKDQPLAWRWNKPTLIVIDYAAARVHLLRDWLSDLLAERAGPENLRVLLLERYADTEHGWWREVFSNGSYAGDAISRLQYGIKGPLRLLPIRSARDRRSIFEAMCRLVSRGRHQRMATVDAAELLRSSWGGHPLFLMMAAVNAVEAGLRATLSLGSGELAFRVARHELARIRGFAEGNSSREKLAGHLAAIVTLQQGISATELIEHSREESAALGLESAGDADTLVTLLERALPSADGNILPVSPDIVGEALVLEVLGQLGEPRARSALVRASGRAWDDVVSFVLRLVEDFYSPSHSHLVDWVELLGNRASRTRSLPAFVARLPAETVALRELAAEWTQELVDRCRHAGEPSALAQALESSASRLSALGRWTEALERAEEAVDLRVELARRDPRAFGFELVAALDTLANCLIDSGHRHRALERAMEAATLCRTMASEGSVAHRQYAAKSLVTLAISLGDLGRWQEAVGWAEEAVDLYRALVSEWPEANRHRLAMALDTLSANLSRLDRNEEALTHAREEVELFRALASERPEASKPDLASALGTLANCLCDLGRHEEGLAFAEEATTYFEALAADRPDAFRPDLAASLNDAAAFLSDLGRADEALERAERAIALRRLSNALHPRAFGPGLALSLHNSATILSQLGRRREAFGRSEEALQLLRPFHRLTPAVFQPWIESMEWAYIALGEILGEDLDEDLLTPMDEPGAAERRDTRGE